MAKLTKHAEVLNQLHTMVKKQASEAQKNISGAPGHDVKSESVSDEHEHTNKNSVGPENVAQGYHQKPSEDPSKPLASAKTAQDLGAEILNIIRKQGEAQSTVTGEPGDVKSESVDDKHEHEDKNAVKPENNKQDYKQEASKDESTPLDSAKQAAELASKVASYDLGRQFCAALLKTAAEENSYSEYAMLKEAGRRDFDAMIAEAAEQLSDEDEEAVKQAEYEGAYAFDEYIKQASAEDEEAVKQAEYAGAQYFDELCKQAAYEESIAENEELKAKLAEYEAVISEAINSHAVEEQQEKLASSVAEVVLNKLKSEVVDTAS